MRLGTFLTTAITALATLTSAQNAFTYPVNGNTLNAGSTVTLKWTPTTQGTISLVLRSGPASDLDAGTTIASSVPNSGTYTWSIPSSLVAGTDYALEIIDDANENIYNYTPQFTISSNAVASSSASASVSASASASMSASASASSAASSSAASSMSAASASSASMMTASMMSASATSASTAAGTIMPDNGAGNAHGARSGFAAVAALAGVVAML